MEFADILTKDQILTDLQATNRWEAIDELINSLVTTGKIKPENREPITAVVRKRETSMSTGIGFGIGIPHASTDLITEVVGALGRSKKGVNFDALDNQPVTLVMLFLVPHGPSWTTGAEREPSSAPRWWPRRLRTGTPC